MKKVVAGLIVGLALGSVGYLGADRVDRCEDEVVKLRVYVTKRLDLISARLDVFLDVMENDVILSRMHNEVQTEICEGLRASGVNVTQCY